MTLVLKKLIPFFLLIPISMVQAKDFWGSIAVDQSSGVAGTAYNFDTEQKAMDASIKMCRKKGGSSKCKAVSSWANACSAAAWSPKSRYARTAMSDTSMNAAEQDALARCIQLEGDRNCKIVSSVCTSWETEEVIWW